MSERGGFAANGVSSPNGNSVEEWEPRVTAVDTVHGDSARLGDAARAIADEVTANARMMSTAVGDAVRDADDVCPTK